MLSHPKCPLCGSADTAEIYECTDHLVSGEKFPVTKCNSCGFVYTGRYPEEKDSGRYYQSDEYISHSDTGKGLMNTIYHIARRWMLSGKYRLLKEVSGTEQSSVLDIGSGTGYFPAFMKRKGWVANGIEINKTARDYAIKYNKIALMPPADIDSLNSGSYDIITMWHSLEHFYRPEEYLNSSHRLLKKDGLLLIALPNHLSCDARKYGKDWAAWDVPRHLWHFSPGTIKDMAGRNNFRFLSVRRLSLDAFYVSALTEKYKESSLPLVRGFITGFISYLRSLNNINKTSSLVYVFKKEE